MLTRFDFSAITSFASAIQWLRSTFLFVRITKNPKYYALAGSEERSPTERLEEICLGAVNNLVSSEIVDEQADSDFLTSTGMPLPSHALRKADGALISLRGYDVKVLSFAFDVLAPQGGSGAVHDASHVGDSISVCGVQRGSLSSRRKDSQSFTFRRS